jgi:hypothetical protein
MMASTASGDGLYSDETAVLLGVSPIEARACFAARGQGARPALRMPDRVRRAALEPLEPLFESVASASDRPLELME